MRIGLNLQYVRMLFMVMSMLVFPLGLTLYAEHITSENVRETTRAKFTALASESEKALLHRMDSYKRGLLGGRGFLEGSQAVSREEWRIYVEALDVLKNFPGINGIGIINDVQTEDVDTFLKDVRADGAPYFEIKPEGKHPANFVITYIEPVSINEAAVGLNIAFEPNRYQAATRSRDTGRAAVTKHVPLVQDNEKTPGFLLLLPVYHHGMPVSTVQERRAAFRAWIYAPFIIKNFMKNLTSSQGKTLHLKVYDGAEETPDTLIFDSQKPGAKDATASFEVRKKINLMQQTWTLVWTSTDEFERLEQNNEPLLVLIAGMFFTGILAVVLIVVAIRERHAEQTVKTSFFLPIGVFLVAISGVFFLQQQVVLKERQFITDSTRKEAEVIRNAITANMMAKILALERMAERWTVRGGTPEKEWLHDAKNYVRDQPGLKTVEWVDASYRVRRVEPLAGNEQVVGLDVLFDEQRRNALKNASEKRIATITEPLDLLQGYRGFLAYFPVRKATAFDGFIVGIFNIQELLDSALPQYQRDDFAFTVLSRGGVVIYQQDMKAVMAGTPWMTEEKITFYDQEWRLQITPKESFLRTNQTLLPKAIFLAGTVLAVLLTLITAVAQRSNAKSNLLAEKENLLSMFVKHAPAAVAMFDRDVRYMAASDRWYRDYGLQGREIIGKSHYEIFPEIPIKHPHWLEIHQRCLAGEVIREDEDVFLREDGRQEWLRYELRPWRRKQGDVGGIIMFTEVITERKQMDTMKDEFISTINHELRTPLTSIQGALGLLKAIALKDLDEKGQRLLNLSYDNCLRLVGLVNDILDIEKIMAGKMTFERESVNVATFVDEVVAQNYGYADKYGVSFNVVSHLNKESVFADKNRLNQALTNLLSNAAKFSPAGGTVLITLSKKGRSNIRISVHDDGPGIPKDFQSKIFERFAQADSSSTRAKGGTGLGLSITKTIIEAFDGQITFETVEGKGTTFHVLLALESKRKKNNDG